MALKTIIAALSLTLALANAAKSLKLKEYEFNDVTCAESPNILVEGDMGKCVDAEVSGLFKSYKMPLAPPENQGEIIFYENAECAGVETKASFLRGNCAKAKMLKGDKAVGFYKSYILDGSASEFTPAALLAITAAATLYLSATLQF